MYKNKMGTQTPSKLKTKLPPHGSQSPRPSACRSPAASSRLCFANRFFAAGAGNRETRAAQR